MGNLQFLQRREKEGKGDRFLTRTTQFLSSFLATSHGHGSGRGSRETRTIPSLLPSRTCSIRLCRVKTMLKTRSRKNCAQNSLASNGYSLSKRLDFFFSSFFLSTPRLIDLSSNPRLEISTHSNSLIHLRAREKKRHDLSRVISRIFIVRFERARRETSLVKKNVNTRRNTRTEIPGDGHVHRVFIAQCITTRLETLC